MRAAQFYVLPYTRFLTWGIVLVVFGLRIIFPLAT
jgi:hypothetical protein